MKKIIALFLVAIICLSFVACGNNGHKENTEITTEKKVDKHTQAIVGTWKSTSFYTLTFNNDKTGTIWVNGENKELTWTYNEDLSCYDIASSFLYSTLNFFLKNDEGVNYLECSGLKMYRTEDFDKVLEEYLDECRAELDEEYNFSSAPKIEFGKQYTTNDISFTFTELLVEGNEFNLYIEVVNNSTKSIEAITQSMLEVGWSYKFDGPCNFFGEGMGIVFDLSFNNEGDSLNSGETTIIKVNISSRNIIGNITSLGQIVGFASCSIGNDSYYIDLSKYTIKQD